VMGIVSYIDVLQGIQDLVAEAIQDLVVEE
jgi:hypothetical protein